MTHRLLPLLLVLALAGCQGELTMDLATETPFDAAVTAVVIPLRGLEFITEQGSTHTLEFTDAQPVDLMRLGTDDTVMRLFTDESLPDGRYTGVRLLIDDDEQRSAYVAVAGRQHELSASAGNFAALTLHIEEDRSSRDAFTLVLDLRRSLRRDDQQYRLEPVLRATDNEQAARVDGTFELNCNPSSDRPAVLLYEGSGLDRDELQEAAREVFAIATPRLRTGMAESYALHWLPPGGYTLAATCQGPADGDDARATSLRYIRSMRIERNEALVESFP